MAVDGELAEVARHALWRARIHGQARSPSSARTNFRSKCSRPARSCPACRCLTPCRTAPSRWATPRAITTSARTQPSLSARPCRSASTRRQQEAWQFHGGGMELLNDFFKTYNCWACRPATPTCQMGGWFRKEIKEPRRHEGLEVPHRRFCRRACCGKLGVVPQQLAAGDIYPALEKGTIDAAEWVGPYDDEKLGFVKVAQVLLLSGLVGRRRATTSSGQSDQVERTAEDLPGA